ncbi:alpha/beta-hydrolase [Ascodesmis nigricans]|uniref:Alpha/beta-hydrolase n=1 Tax=Ascodesmis nigricans TaxID=341454 RepID=A0A4S2MTP2_9PEZI|nr:alpha/beta-hydrolase [Ascodesmis nigricans]
MFPLLHIYPPTAEHTHTVILLHGRGSDGPELAEDLFAGRNLSSDFPSIRWVFPTATTQRSTVFQEDMTEWFDIYSLSDPDSRGELQLPGLRNSVEYILGLIEDEVQRLQGDAEKVILGGISQGMATSVWALLAGGRKLGGFVGMSGWFPFAGEAEKGSPVEAVRSRIGLEGWGENEVQHTPAWLGHGEDDAYVDIEVGKRAREILGRVLLKVESKTYKGAEEEGHWIKEPEEFEDIAGFLGGIIRTV